MKKALPNISILLIIIVCLVLNLGFNNWEKKEKVIEGDGHSYYAYLPAYFIYDDIKLKESEYRFGYDYYLFYPRTNEHGHKVIDKTMGVSILLSPFYFIAHATASLGNEYPLNGWSEPYKFFILLSILFYLIIGLEFLKKILLYFQFSAAQIAISLLVIGLGTNLLCYSSVSASMPIVYSFCFISIFIYYAIQWHISPSIKNTIFIGIAYGLITLIKPNNAYLFIIFLFYGINSFADFKNKLKLFAQKFYLIWLMLQIAVIIWIPQFAYWKFVTGHFFYLKHIDNDYYLKLPKIISGLFSFRKGWLIYTPVMIVALAGIYYMKHFAKSIRFSLILILVISTYTIFQSWKHSFAPSFGQAGFIEFYPLLAIPLTAFISQYLNKGFLLKASLFSVLLGFTILNIFQTIQYEKGVIHADGMTRQLYFKQFGKLNRIDDYYSYVKSPDYDLIKHAGGALTMQLHQRKEIGKDSVIIKAYNGKFVGIDTAYKNLLYADKENAAAETFYITRFERNELSIMATNKKFVSSELHEQSQIDAIREKAADWEIFKIIEHDNHKVALKAANNKYWSIAADNNQLFATSDSIGQTELFEMIFIKNKK